MGGKVDQEKAMQQWQAISEVYESIGIEVEVIEGQPGLPDMVFSANQTLPFVKDGKPGVILSNMFAKERQGEVQHYADWFKEYGYELHVLPGEEAFEGMGDNVYHADGSFIWAGYGHRSSPVHHAFVEEVTGKDLKPLKLVYEFAYHLDVCLAVMNKDCALVLRQAFDDEGWAMLNEVYSDLIEMTEEEFHNFVGNAHCPDGKNVILQQGSERIVAELQKRGFTVHEVDTSEFIKAGGSVFCMKLDLPA